MAYHFRKNEGVGAALQRIVQEEMRKAARAIGPNSDAAAASGVHDARKAVKRVRSLLRLLRSDLGTAFRQQNNALREGRRSAGEMPYRDRNAAAAVASGPA